MKLFVSLLMAFTFAFATSAQYKTALEYFQKKEYKKAYDSFELALEEDYSDPKISFYIGRSAYELGLYEQAMIAYQRVLILDEMHIRSYLELARTYIALKQPALAKAELETAKRLKPPKTVIKNINMLIAYIEGGKQKSFWNFFISLGAGYDSNINAQAGSDYIEANLGLAAGSLSGVDPISAKLAQEVAVANNVYQINGNKFFLESTFLVYGQQYLDNSEYDLLYLSLTTAPGTVLNDYKITLPLNYSRIYFGDISLLDAKSAQLKVEKVLMKTLVARVAAKYETKDYTKIANEGRDSDIAELELGVDYLFGKNLFKLAYKYANEDRSNSSATLFIDRSINNFNLGYSRPLTDSLFFNAQYNYIMYGYDDAVPTGPNSGDDREDDYQAISASLTQSFTKVFSTTLEYKYVDNNSNYVVMDYDKSTYLVKLNASF